MVICSDSTAKIQFFSTNMNKQRHITSFRCLQCIVDFPKLKNPFFRKFEKISAICADLGLKIDIYGDTSFL